MTKNTNGPNGPSASAEEIGAQLGAELVQLNLNLIDQAVQTGKDTPLVISSFDTEVSPGPVKDSTFAQDAINRLRDVFIGEGTVQEASSDYFSRVARERGKTVTTKVYSAHYPTVFDERDERSVYYLIERHEIDDSNNHNTVSLIASLKNPLAADPAERTPQRVRGIGSRIVRSLGSRRPR